jgi:hypothetical protein
MLAMLTEMKRVPHRHFGMPGSIQKHVLVDTVVLGLLLTIFFDLTRIAAMDIISYLVMDIAVHWGVLRYRRHEIGARFPILVIAIILDLIVLAGFVWIKSFSDPLVVGVAGAIMLAIFIVEVLFLRNNPVMPEAHNQG